MNFINVLFILIAFLIIAVAICRIVVVIKNPLRKNRDKILPVITTILMFVCVGVLWINKDFYFLIPKNSSALIIMALLFGFFYVFFAIFITFKEYRSFKTKAV